jgi:hypothetical protein
MCILDVHFVIRALSRSITAIYHLQAHHIMVVLKCINNVQSAIPLTIIVTIFAYFVLLHGRLLNCSAV